MKFVKLTEEEFQLHADTHEMANFLQTVEMANLRKKRGWETEFVGVKDGETIVASALLGRMKIRLGYYYEIDGGFLADYTNKEVVKVLVDGLKVHLRENGGLYMTMTPNLTYQKRNGDGEPTAEPEKEILAHLESLGLVHQGFAQGFSSNSPRWVFIKDMTTIENEKDLRKSYQKDAVYSVKKTAQFGICLRDLSFEELGKFKTLTEHTAERRGFADKPLEYYQAVYKSFGEKAKFVVAEINFQTYIENLRKREQELQIRLDKIAENLKKTPNSTKMLNQQREFMTQMKTHEARIQEAEVFRKTDGDENVILAGALFILGKKEVVYLFSGTYDKYKNFYAPFLIQDDMLKLTVDNQVPKYNFYGIDGTFDGTDGVLKFKQSFTGDVEEKIGSFDLIVQPKKYKLYQMLKRLLGR